MSSGDFYCSEHHSWNCICALGGLITTSGGSGLVNKDAEPYLLETLTSEYPFFNHAIMIVSGANMANELEIKQEIAELDRIIDTGYYDDEDGNELMKHIRTYLQSKIEKT